MSATQQSFDYLFAGAPLSPPLKAEEYLPLRSRTSDPLSSKKAEEDCKRSGVMRGQRVLAMELVEKFPGRTSKQLADLGTLDRYQLAKRLPELRELKLVRTTHEGSSELRWWPNAA